MYMTVRFEGGSFKVNCHDFFHGKSSRKDFFPQEKFFSSFLLTNSFIADSGMDLENPSPLHVFVGVLTSLTTTFFCMANEKETKQLSLCPHQRFEWASRLQFSYCVQRRKNALLIQIGVEIVWDNVI